MYTLMRCCLLGVFIVNLCFAASIETEQGVVGYDDTPMLPWCSYLMHDATRPLPNYVDPGPAPTNPANPPSDAVILFDGTDLSQWQANEWEIVNGIIQAGNKNLVTKQSFGDCQIHIEFMIPEEPAKNFYNRGNSGVFIMGKYEVQIFDSHPSHDKQIYPDGQCAAIYGDTPPMVNACRKGGQWQTYDIIFTAPVFENNKLVKMPMITMFHNNILVHLNSKIHAPSSHRQILSFEPHPDKLPLMLQGHGSPVLFRNIWVRPLSKTKQ